MNDIPARDRIEAVRVASDAEDLAKGLSRWNPLRWVLERMAALCRLMADNHFEDSDDYY